MPLVSDALKTSVVMVAVEVVDLDGVLDADGGDDAKGAMGFSCQKILDFLMPEDTGLARARRYWTFSCQKILDFLVPEDTGLSCARRYWT